MDSDNDRREQDGPNRVGGEIQGLADEILAPQALRHEFRDGVERDKDQEGA